MAIEDEALLTAFRECRIPGNEFNHEEYLAANPQLITDVRSLLARHYSPELLSSREARMGFVAPDRLALPS